MKLADDERARVPFALVGVLLLVASATTAATFAAHDPAPAETRADRVAERTETGASVAVAGAARTALRAAARNPVVSPADTRYGNAVSEDEPFRDALRLRVYARAERALRDVDATAGGVTASVALERVQTTADAERAIERVAVVGLNDSRVRVVLEGVRVTLRRDGRVVSRSRRDVSVTVASPALALRKRVERFERLLDRGALAGPGLSRRVTDYLHRVVWLRGPLQYAGLPIANVLANRHVEVATNRALLSLQQSAFGRADSDGQNAYWRALARVGFTDVLAAAQEGATRRAASVLRGQDVPEVPAHVGIPSMVDTATPPRQTVPVGVNVTADRAFVGFADADGPHSLAGTLRAAYTATADRTVEATQLDSTTRRSGSVPENWTLAGTTRDRSVDVRDGAPESGVLPEPFRRVGISGRRVVVTERTARTYAAPDGDRERTVVERHRETHRVTVALGYEVDPPGRAPYSDASEAVLDAPARSVSSTLHDRIAACATRELGGSAGGVDALARRAVEGEQLNRRVLVHPQIPESVRERAYDAATALRRQARNVSAHVSTGALAEGRVPVDTLRERVVGLHDAPSEYESVTSRAVAAVRETYLARLDARLAERRADGALRGVGGALGDRGVESVPDAAPTVAAPGPVAAVDGAPAYLPLAEVDSELAPGVESSYHPLAARNENWFAIPHGDAAGGVLSETTDDPRETARLGTAGQVLRAANRTLAAAENATLAAHQRRLQAEVEESVSEAASAYRGVLAASNVSFTAAERRAATRRALSRWATLDARARAVANGSAARAVAEEAALVARVSAERRDLLAARFRTEAPTVSDRGAVRVEAGLVENATRSARRVGRTVAKHALSRAGEVAAERAAEFVGTANLGAVPAGLPVAPVPGFWYATVNAWTVSVRGSWAEFAVRARGGTPVGPGDRTTFVRENETVAFDVNGDGRSDELGRNEQLSFEVETTVVVVVPAGPRGVGDVDGQRTESSPGW